MTDERRPVVALVGTALLWSVGGVLIKWVQWHPMAIMGVRSAIAAVMLWAIARRPKFDWSPAQIMGAVAYAVTVMLYVPACKLTTAANAILLQYTAPIWVAIFGAWFLKEKAQPLDWLFVVLSLGGMALFFYEGIGTKSFLGDVLGALSGITIAWMMLFLRKQKDGAPLESVLLGNILAAIGGLPFYWKQPAPSWQGWVALVVLGAFQLGLAYALYAYAIKYVRALEAVIILTLEPILNPIWVLLLIGERPQGMAFAGGVVVLLSVTVRALLIARQSTKQAAVAMPPGAS